MQLLWRLTVCNAIMQVQGKLSRLCTDPFAGPSASILDITERFQLRIYVTNLATKRLVTRSRLLPFGPSEPSGATDTSWHDKTPPRPSLSQVSRVARHCHVSPTHTESHAPSTPTTPHRHMYLWLCPPSTVPFTVSEDGRDPCHAGTQYSQDSPGAPEL